MRNKNNFNGFPQKTGTDESVYARWRKSE